MNSQVNALINSGKKIKSRTEKLIANLILSKFSGTLKIIFPEESSGTIFFVDDKIKTTVSPQKLADYIETSLFMFESGNGNENKDDLKSWDSLEFLYRVIENIDRTKLIKYSESFITEYLTIKPEAINLKFISKELQIFTGREKFQILPFYQKYCRVIYFLLLSRFAAIIPSSPEEKKIILERAQKILREGEGYERKVEAPKEKSKDEQLTDFLNAREKFKDVFHLFELQPDMDEKELQKSYLKLVQKIHPDRLHDVSTTTADRAVNLFRSVSEAYEMLKNEEERKEIIKLMKKYQPIKNRSDYVRLKEYDEAVFKGTALERLGQFAAAKEVFQEIYKQTKTPDALEKKILAQWQLRKKWDNDQKSTNYLEIKEDINTLKMLKDPVVEVLYILIEIHEHFGEIADCMKILNMILRFYPEDHRATATKHRIAYYEALRKKNK
jgi:tetratricopeptide (TPR) repeat protein